MEAALRTAVETLTGEELKNVEFQEVRGTEGIKEATYNVAGMDVKVAVASGLGNARKLLDKVKSGEADYHFIEIMGCPGGCVNGGGQPQVRGSVRNLQMYVPSVQRLCMTTMRLNQFVSLMRIRLSSSSTKSSLVNLAAIRHMRFCIQAM